jgi:hypothetical protein
MLGDVHVLWLRALDTLSRVFSTCVFPGAAMLSERLFGR